MADFTESQNSLNIPSPGDFTAMMLAAQDFFTSLAPLRDPVPVFVPGPSLVSGTGRVDSSSETDPFEGTDPFDGDQGGGESGGTADESGEPAGPFGTPDDFGTLAGLVEAQENLNKMKKFRFLSLPLRLAMKFVQNRINKGMAELGFGQEESDIGEATAAVGGVPGVGAQPSGLGSPDTPSGPAGGPVGGQVGRSAPGGNPGGPSGQASGGQVGGSAPGGNPGGPSGEGGTGGSSGGGSGAGEGGGDADGGGPGEGSGEGGRHAGGLVSPIDLGPDVDGSGKDTGTIPIQAGEFVIRKSSTEKIGLEFLSLLNRI